MKYQAKVALLVLFCFVLGSGFVCLKAATVAYDTLVAAKAFTDKAKTQHPECATGAKSTVCVDLNKAVAAKDVLADALSIYCAGPDFNGGGVCNPPAKGTPAFTQASAKLSAALASYNQTETDLKGVLK